MKNYSQIAIARYLVISLLYLIHISHALAITNPSVLPTASSPGEISSPDDLIWLSQNESYWSEDWILVNDIDFHDTNNNGIIDISDDTNGDGVIDHTDVDWDGSGAIGSTDNQYGFSPIGEYVEDSDTIPFDGDFDGQNHYIKNLYINRTNKDGVGLFCYTKRLISNIHLVDADVTGNDMVGGVIGISHGTTEHCSITGRITGVLRTGGICGDQATRINTLSNCKSTADVTGSRHVGGVVGYNRGVISRSVNSGLVIGEGYRTHIGGVVGTCAIGAHVLDSYNTGSIEGKTFIGGVVGHVVDTSSMTTCYSSGTVMSTGIVGALVGRLEEGQSFATYSYYDSDNANGLTAVGRVDSAIMESLKGYPLSDFNDPANFVNFNFGSTDSEPWQIIESTTGRPYLYWEENSTHLHNTNYGPTTDYPNTGNPNFGYRIEAGINNTVTDYSFGFRYKKNTDDEWITETTTSSSSTTFTIETLGKTGSNSEFENMSLYFIQPLTFNDDETVLGDMIYINTDEKYSGGTGTSDDPFLIKNTRDFIEVTNTEYDWDKNYYFAQTEDIDLHIAGGINDKDVTDAASVDWNDDGKLNTQDSYGLLPIGSTSIPFDGVYQGYNSALTSELTRLLENTYIQRTSESNVGLFGHIKSATIQNLDITNAYTEGLDSVGGLVGNIDGVISDSSHIESRNITGEVIGGYATGGLIGINRYAKINNSSSTSTVTSKTSSSIGGLIGMNTSVIENSYASGQVSGINSVGGFVGTHTGSNASIKRCYANSVVTSAVDEVGGFVGTMEEQSTISESYATGDVTSSGKQVGGFAGTIKDNSTLSLSYATGKLIGNNQVGGMVGIIESSQANNCYAKGSVYGLEDIGAFIGKLHKTGTEEALIANCYATGYVIQNSSSHAGFAGLNSGGTFENCIFDKQTTDENFGIHTDNNGQSGNVNGYETESFMDITTFSAYNFGNNEANPWTMLYSTYGRPHLYWQDEAVHNSLSTPLRNSFTLGVTSLNTPIGEDPNSGVRYMHLDDEGNTLSPWAFISTQNTSSDLLVNSKDTFDNDIILVQPYIIKSNDDFEYGDMILSQMLDISTEYVDSIGMNSIKTHANINAGTSITEHGFMWSYTLNNDSETWLEHTDVNQTIVGNETTNGASIGDFTSTLDQLPKRTPIYVRSYIKTGNYTYHYGDIIRCILEERDFSLALDGNDALMVSQNATSKSIGNTGIDGSFAIDFWMKSDNMNEQSTILSYANEGMHEGRIISLKTDSTFEYFKDLGTSTVALDGNTKIDSLWHHIAISYNGTQAIVYIDGEIDIQADFEFTTPSTDLNLCIGAELNASKMPAYGLNGKLDALRFWNTNLSQDQALSLAKDIIAEDAAGNTILKGSEEIVDNLPWSKLSASFNFNVSSTIEAVNTVSPIAYEDDSIVSAFPFFHEDSRLNTNNSPQSTIPYSYNIIALGDAKPSVDLPRVNWNSNSTNNQWLNANNWSGLTYHGQGISDTELSNYKDVSLVSIPDNIDNCWYTVINGSTNGNTALIDADHISVNILIDNESAYKTYKVDPANNASLSIKHAVRSNLFTPKLEVSNGGVKVESGSIEVP